MNQYEDEKLTKVTDTKGWNMVEMIIREVNEIDDVVVAVV